MRIASTDVWTLIVIGVTLTALVFTSQQLISQMQLPEYPITDMHGLVSK